MASQDHLTSTTITMLKVRMKIADATLNPQCDICAYRLALTYYVGIPSSFDNTTDSLD
jgi:hypothetical protein